MKDALAAKKAELEAQLERTHQELVAADAAVAALRTRGCELTGAHRLVTELLAAC